MSFINISICLSDIPASARKTAANGKVYANFSIKQKKEVDKFENTHGVAIAQTKEEREQKVTPTWVGNGKEYKFENREQAAPAPQTIVNGDLAF